jgi:signal transduction histidine kinase
VFVFWGAELTCFYNDAYGRSLGPEKNPAILGMPGEKAWPEIWAIIGPQIEQVMRGDTATWHENQLVPIIRHGELQDVYWTYSYGPIDEPAAPHGVGGVLVICTETTQQVLTEQRLAVERGRFAQLFEQAPTFMTVLRGPNHVFDLANPSYLRLVGDRPIIGRSVADALPEAAEQGWTAILDRVYASGEAYLATAAPYSMALAPGGAVITRYLDFVYQPIKEADGSVSGIFIVGVDASTRAIADQELRDADRRKDEFLAMLAHELRNPLAPIRTAAEVIARRVTTDVSVQRAADVVRRQATQLTRIVDDLLDVSRISMGHITLQREALLMSEVIDHAAETVAPLWREKQHQISTSASLEPLYVAGDLARLVQTFGNVMTNAAKYTGPGGSIGIKVTGTADTVIVAISDTGAGMSPEFMPHIFDLFAQADRTLDRAQGGLGIGLSVVKKLVEMHGGTIVAHSEGLGRGSEFVIRLPRVPAPAGRAEAAASSKVKPLRVLIVDDNEDAANSLSELLKLDGHQTQPVYSALDALALAQEFDPEVVLLDIGLPMMDGFEVARRMRQSPSRKHTKIIALTGYGQAEDRERAQSAGFDAHLVKPVDFDVLTKLLES